MSDVLDRLLAGKLTEADRQAIAERFPDAPVVAHAGQAGGSLHEGQRIRFGTPIAAEENRQGRIEEYAAWAEALMERNGLTAEKARDCMTLSDHSPPEHEEEVDAAIETAKRRRKRKPKPMGQSIAGQPDEHEDDYVSRTREAEWAEERLGIDHETLAEEMFG